MSFSEKLKLTSKMVLDKRFRRDYKALKYASNGYIHYAIEILEDFDVLEMLEDGATLGEIQSEKGIEHREMLEHMLLLLTSEDMLEKSGDIYHIKDLEDPFTDEQFRWLEQNYPHSTEWTEFLVEHAPNVLETGEPIDEAGFEDEFLEVWDKMMEEAPYSFKKMMIKKTLDDIEDGDRIIDLGCGSGSILELILRNVDKEVHLTGVDLSQDSLDLAEERLKDIKDLTDSERLKQNIERVELEQHNLMESFPEGEYDYAVTSLMFNHIPEEDRKRVLENMSGLLKENGRLGIYQFIQPSRDEPLSFWPLHCVPTHRGHPYRDEFLPKLEDVFGDVDTSVKDTIIIAEK